MKSTLQKWGNSLALRIPKGLADEIHVKAGSGFDLKVDVSGALVLKPSHRKATPRLRDLLARITPQNRHSETDWGGPVGKEVW